MMNKREAKNAYWFEMIQEQERSGLTQRAFCKEKNLKHHQLHYYRHLLKKGKSLAAEKIMEEKIVPVQISALPIAKAESKEIRLLLQNGIQCVLSYDMEIGRIGKLVDVLLSC